MAIYYLTNPEASKFVNPPSTSPSNSICGPSSCLFNFNNLVLDSNNFGAADIVYTIAVNGTIFVTLLYWQKRHGHKRYRQSSSRCRLSARYNAYNDSPGASNTVTLINQGSVTLHLRDGFDSGDPGRVNIYRVLQDKANH